MNKGFTLVEVIAVIAILGLLVLLAFPQMLNMIKEGEKEVSDATKTLVYTASSQYTVKYTNDFPKKEGNVYCVTVGDLVEEEFLLSSIVGDEFNLDTKIKITISSEL